MSSSSRVQKSASPVPVIGIMGTPVSSGNRGVLALAESLVRLCLEAVPGATIALCGSDRRGDPVTMHPTGAPLAIPQVTWRLNRRAGLRHHLLWIVAMSLLYRAVPIRGFRDALARRVPWIGATRSALLVGDVRGGDSFSDIYGMQRFVIATLAVWSVILVRGSIVQFPQTYGPYKSRLARWIARYILRRSRVIVARDTHSQRVAQELVGPNQTVLLSPDVAFALHVREPAQLEIEPPLPLRGDHETPGQRNDETTRLLTANHRLLSTAESPTVRQSDGPPPTVPAPSIPAVSDLCPLTPDVCRPSSLTPLRALRPIGINVNGLMFNGGYHGGNQFGLTLDYPQYLEQLVCALLEEYAGELLLVPHTYAPTGDVESDNAACVTLRERLPETLRTRVRIVTGDYDCHEIKSVIGCCDFFIGSRMHSCIGALSQGVPCVGVAYSMKFVGVFESVGMGDFVVDAREYDSAGAVARTLELFRNRDAFRAPLAASVANAQGRLRSVFRDITRAV